MKKNRVDQHLKKKIADYLDSIEDKDLRQKVQSSLIVTGGAINSLLLDEKVRDYDIYLKDGDVVQALCEYYIKQWTGQERVPVVELGEIDELRKSDDFEDRYAANRIWIDKEPMHLQKYTYSGEERLGIYAGHFGGQPAETPGFNPWNTAESIDAQEPAEPEYDPMGMNWVNEQEKYKKDTFDEKKKYRPVYFSCNAITLSDGIQLITRFWGNPEEIHSNFDFEHVKNYWTPRGGLKLLPKALECLITKELIYTGSKYPVASVIRTRKYINRGYTVTAGQYLKMIFQINDLDLHDLYTLREQLTGIDAVYFIQLLSELRHATKGQLSSTEYMINMVDKVLERDYRIDDESIYPDET